MKLFAVKCCGQFSATDFVADSVKGVGEKDHAVGVVELAVSLMSNCDVASSGTPPFPEVVITAVVSWLMIIGGLYSVLVTGIMTVLNPEVDVEEVVTTTTGLDMKVACTVDLTGTDVTFFAWTSFPLDDL